MYLPRRWFRRIRVSQVDYEEEQSTPPAQYTVRRLFRSSAHPESEVCNFHSDLEWEIAHKMLLSKP